MMRVAGIPKLAPRPPMGNGPMMNGEFPRHKRCAGRDTRAVTRIESGESDPFGGDLVHIRCGISVIAVATHVIRTHGIEVKVENSHFSPFVVISAWYPASVFPSAVWQFSPRLWFYQSPVDQPTGWAPGQPQRGSGFRFRHQASPGDHRGQS